MNSQNFKIKQSISLLCKLLKLASISSISPEVFRQAMLNRKEAISDMHQLILSTLSYVGVYVDKKNGDISKLLERIGYPRYRLLENCQSSSQELLLCFSWLLHVHQVIEVIKNVASQVPNFCKFLQINSNSKKKMLHLKTTMQQVEEKCKLRQSEDNLSFTTDEFHSLTFCEQSNYIGFLLEKLEVDFGLLKGLNASIAKLNYKITKQSSLDCEQPKQNVSADELLLLKHSNFFEMFEKQLEQKVLVLQTYLKWRDCEDVFWSWQNEVINEESTESVNKYEDSCTRAFNCLCMREKLNEFYENLTELKQTLYEKQRKCLNFIKEQPSKFNKLRIEQKLQVKKTVDEIFEQCPDLSSPAQLISSREYAVSKDFYPLSVENQMLCENVKLLKKDFETNQLLWKEELTLLSNQLVGDNIIVM